MGLLSFLNLWEKISIHETPRWVKRLAFKHKTFTIYKGRTFEYKVSWHKKTGRPITLGHYPNTWVEYKIKKVPEFKRRLRK